MMHRVLTILPVALLLAAQPQNPDSKAALDGTWTVVSLENEGKKSADKDIAGMKLIFEGNKLLIKKGKKTLGGGTFKIDLTKKPHAIDYKEGPDIISPYDVGIIETNGNDMKYCTTADKQKRPTAFDSKQGMLFVLKKELAKAR